MDNRNQVWNVAKWVGILLIVFLVAVSIKQFKEIGYIGKNINITNTITVNGKGEAISIPDVATFTFSVTENANTVKEAQTKATEIINKAISVVKEGGVQEKDIKTLSYNINPHYEWTQGPCTYVGCPSGKNVLKGYDVSETVQVKVRDVSKAGDLFDAIGGTGVKNVSDLQFSIDDIDTVKAQAREDAINNAKEKAQKIADNLNVRLVRIIGFYDSSDDQYLPYAREMGMGGDSVSALSLKSAPQVPTGEQKVTATVNITYEIR